MKHVGARHRPIDWDQRSSGKVVYSGDLALPGMLDCAMLRSPHSHARILSIDTSQAAMMPGVKAVACVTDFAPGARYIHEGERDRAPFADQVVRFIGQEVAAVAADTRAQAQAAIRAIKVVYEPIDAPLNVDESLGGPYQSLHERPTHEPNVSRRVLREWGDFAAGLASSALSVGGKFRTQRQAHVCMETLITIAHWREDEKRLHVWTSTQAPYFIVKEVSQLLGLEKEQVVCHEVGVGGGFGAKSKICDVEAIVGLLSRKCGRPVRMRLVREEEFETTKTRHPFHINLKIHADRDGLLQAIEGDIKVDNGAFNHSGASVMGAGIKGLGMMYRPQGLKVAGALVDTAITPGGQYRGYGTTQTSFALESLVDELAEKLKIDPIELRLRNANQPGDVTLVGARLRTAGLAACLRKARDEIGWISEKASRKPGRGVGVAAAVHTSGSFTEPGSNRSDAAIDVYPDGHVRVRFGGADAGTGQRTIMAQIAADILGVAFERVEVLTMESDRTPFDMGSWSSRGTHFAGHAVRVCATETADRLKAIAAGQIGGSDLRLADGCVVNDAGLSMPLGDAARLSNEAVEGVLSVETSYVDPHMEPADKVTGRGNVSASYNFGVHAAIVEVDRRTGAVKVIDYVAVHDVGQPINPTLVEGQTIGGVAMGIGLALGEELIHEQGKMVNPAYINYAMPRAADLPRIRPYTVGDSDPNGPFGAKAIGECSINPPAATIANAVYDAIGVRIKDLPITPDKILDALAEKESRIRRFPIWNRPSRWWIELVRRFYGMGLLKILHTRNTIAVATVDPAPMESVLRPQKLTDAVASLSPDILPLGGGTDLNLQRRMRMIEPRALVAMKTVPELSGITRTPEYIEVGAATTLAKLQRALGADLPVLSEAIATIANPQVREMATVAGNLAQAKRCWFYRSGFNCYKRAGGLAPCYAIEGDHRFYHAAIDGHRCQATTPSDLATVLTALDAEAMIVGKIDDRIVPMSSFYTGPGETVLRNDEIIRAIRISASASQRTGAFSKLRLWEGDFAIVSCAISASIDSSGVWRDVRIVLGGVAPIPWRARASEARLEGRKPSWNYTRGALELELEAHAHPLKRNGWKIEAAIGVVEQAFALTQARSSAPRNLMAAE